MDSQAFEQDHEPIDILDIDGNYLRTTPCDCGDCPGQSDASGELANVLSKTGRPINSGRAPQSKILERPEEIEFSRIINAGERLKEIENAASTKQLNRGEIQLINPVAALRPTTELAIPRYIESNRSFQKLLVLTSTLLRAETLTETLSTTLREHGYSVSCHYGAQPGDEQAQIEAALLESDGVVVISNSHSEIGIDLNQIDLIVLDGPTPGVIQRIKKANKNKDPLQVMTPPGSYDMGVDTTILLLNELADQTALLGILCKHWDLPPMSMASNTLGDRMSFAVLTDADTQHKLLTTPISKALETDVSNAFGCTPNQASTRINKLALTCSLLPKGVNELDKLLTDLSGLNEILEQDDGDADTRQLLKIISDQSNFKDHFAGIRASHDETTEAFFEANQGLVGKHLREQLQPYDGRLDRDRPEARLEGNVFLREAIKGFNYREAVNSTADRPFAGYVFLFLQGPLGQKLNQLADKPVDQVQEPVDPRSEGIPGAANLELFNDDLLSELESEIWGQLKDITEQNRPTFAEVGRSLVTPMSGREVSIIYKNVKTRIDYFMDQIRYKLNFIDNLPDRVYNELCIVQLTALTARYIHGLSYAKTADKISFALRSIRTFSSARSDSECPRCARTHSELLTINEGKNHAKRRIPEYILSRTEMILENHNIRLPKVTQARGTVKSKS